MMTALTFDVADGSELLIFAPRRAGEVPGQSWDLLLAPAAEAAAFEPVRPAP
jgi:hypothetical protein